MNNGMIVSAPTRDMDNEPSPNLAGSVVVKFKTAKTYQIELDPDQLTWEDLTSLSEIQDKEARGELSARESMDAVADLLTRLTGQDVKSLPARVVAALLEELQRLGGGLQADTKN